MLTREEVLRRFATLRQARLQGGVRAPHKPLLALFLLGELQRRGTQERAPLVVKYTDVDAVVSPLIAAFGPPSRDKHRAAMPFFHLDASVWNLPRASLDASHALLRDRAARGALDPDVAEALRNDPALLAEVARGLLESNFPPSYFDPICAAVGLDVAASSTVAVPVASRARSTDFRERVLRAYDDSCAFCGYSGMSRQGGATLAPVGLAAAHVHWHALGGPDEVTNGLALCDLHHTLFDRGLLGVGPSREIMVSPFYAPKDARARGLVEGLALIAPRCKDAAVADEHFRWHRAQVFRREAA